MVKESYFVTLIKGGGGGFPQKLLRRVPFTPLGRRYLHHCTTAAPS